MALIKCPECGRERVSDSATSCPDCGFNIKAYYDEQYEYDDYEESDSDEEEYYEDDEEYDDTYDQLSAIIEENKRKQEFQEKYKQYKKKVRKQNRIKMAILDTIRVILGILFVILGLAMGAGAGTDGAVVGLICLFLAFVFLILLAPKKKTDSADDPVENGYECPQCHRRAGHIMSGFGKSVSTAAYGLASNKIGKTYQCKACKYMW